MILVPYFLVGAYLLKIATRPAHYAVGRRLYLRFCGCWPCFGPMHLAAVGGVVCAGPAAFIYARRTHQLENALKRREMALIGLLLVAAVPATLDVTG